TRVLPAAARLVRDRVTGGDAPKATDRNVAPASVLTATPWVGAAAPRCDTTTTPLGVVASPGSHRTSVTCGTTPPSSAESPALCTAQRYSSCWGVAPLAGTRVRVPRNSPRLVAARTRSRWGLAVLPGMA